MEFLKRASTTTKCAIISLNMIVVVVGTWFLLKAVFSLIKTDVVGVAFVLENNFLSSQLTILLFVSLVLLSLQIAFIFPRHYKPNSILTRIRKNDLNTSRLLGVVIFTLQIQVFWFFVHSKSPPLNSLMLLILSSICLILLYAFFSSTRKANTQNSQWIVLGGAFFTYYVLRFESTSNLNHNVSEHTLVWLFLVFFFFLTCQIFRSKFFRFGGINYLNVAALFLLVQICLPRAHQITIHPFESAPFANAALTVSGSLPWRDYLLEHGVWEDSLRLLIPYKLFGSDIDSVAQFLELVIRPFEIFVLIWLISMIFRSNLVGVIILITFSLIEVLIPPSETGFSVFPSPRTLLLWPLLLCLIRYSQRRSLHGAVGVGIFTGLYFLSSPEAIYAVAGVFLSMILVTLRLRQWKLYLLHTFFWLLSSAIIVSLFLQPFHLMSFFFQDLSISGSGYFTAWGALPKLGTSLKFDCLFFLTHITLVYLLVCLFRVIFEYIRNREDNLSQFIGGVPLFVSAVAYYVKFLRWPDWHLLQALSLILISLTFFKLSDNSHFARINDKDSKQSVNLFIVLILIASSVSVSNLGATTVALNSTYNSESKIAVSEAREINGLEDEISLLDFGNEPFTWYTGGSFKPSGGISKTMNILTLDSQKLALERIRRDPPSIVVLGSGWGYWSTPFQNWAAKYELSRFILENYRPLKVVGGYMLMVRGNVFEASSEQIRWLTNLPCDYGYVPKHYKPSLSSRESFSGMPRVTGENIVFSEKSKAPAFRSNQDVKVQLVNMANGGVIRFNLVSSDKVNVVPVFGCPSCVLRGKSDQLRITLESSDQAEVEIYI